MSERTVKLTTHFKVMQIAGSCRLESILVSKEDELLMAQVIDGVIDGAAYRRALAEQYKKANAE